MCCLQELARNVARNVATQYAQQLLTASSPVEVLANTVKHDPQYEVVHAHFNATSSALLGLVGRVLVMRGYRCPTAHRHERNSQGARVSPAKHTPRCQSTCVGGNRSRDTLPDLGAMPLLLGPWS